MIEPNPGFTKHPAAHVGIVIDSSCDMLPTLAQWLGIFVVPNRIIFGEQVYYDGYTMSPGQFYAMLGNSANLPVTKPASPQDYYYAYQSMFARGYAEIVSIHVSGNLSHNVQHA